MTASIWSDGDEVWIGALPPGPAGLSRLVVPGGTLIVDPLEPGHPALHLTDPQVAGESVTALFGIAAWEQVTRALADRVEVAGTAGTGWALADACRLAVVRWLGTHSPDPLDDELLEIEAALLADRLSPIVDLRPSRRALARALQLLEASLEGLPIGATPWGDAAHALVGVAVQQEGEPDSGVLLDDWDHAHALDLLARWERRYALPEASDAAWRAELQAASTERTVLTPVPTGLAMDAAEVAQGAGWRSCSTDWDLVPRGAFDPSEDALRWRVEPAGEGRVTLEVQVASGWDPSGRYLARLLRPDLPAPLCEVTLVRSEELWHGSAVLDQPMVDVDACWMDIVLLDHPRSPRRGPARTAAAGRRWASRAVTRLRLGLGGGATLDAGDPLADAVGCLERARLEYAALAEAREGTSDRQCHLALGIALHGALVRRGEGYEADDLEVELAVEARHLSESNEVRHEGPVLTDADGFGHPAWHLTVAEEALLVPSDPSGWGL